MSSPQIYFVTPDHDEPSWGIGMIYQLVILSKRLGFQTHLLRLHGNKQVPWLEADIEVLEFETICSKICQEDLLIVPEILAANHNIQGVEARKVVFIQNGFLITSGLQGHFSFHNLGYEHALVVMKHLQDIVESFWPMSCSIVPPFVQSYFSAGQACLPTRDRKKQILLFPKGGYEKAGYLDYQIVRSILGRQLRSHALNEWKIIDLENLHHREVASMMQESAFFLNTNCFESLNATVVEAMAAGCITICYEAYGGRDFLENNVNAFVFPNNYVFPMLSKLLALLNRIGEGKDGLEEIQKKGILTAEKYNKENTLIGLQRFYRRLDLV